MYACGQEMEREHSITSLSSITSSEVGSDYSTETGLFMSTFGATVFLSGVVTLALSLLSLVVALTVMLQSCERKNSGILETYTYPNSYDHCKNLAMHAELNGFGSDHFPAICKDVNSLYVRNGHYKRDLNDSVRLAEDFFFNGLRHPRDDGDAVMIDADDLAPENLFNFLWTRIDGESSHDVDMEADYLKHSFVLKLYLTLRSEGWRMILFSRKPGNLGNTTSELLTLAGCRDWSSLVMRKQNEMHMDYDEFLSQEREKLREEGLRIVAVISSQMDALRTTRFHRDRVFKIPNPIFRDEMEDYRAHKL